VPGSKPPAELSAEQLDYLARQVNTVMLTEPRVWGDTRRVVLGRNVQLANALLNAMSGMIVIGDDIVIEAGSVVIGGELPGGRHYAGVPARAIKAIDFDEPPGDDA
jgi:acetyltransferase-like isoleucine patch superfamily enzyme